MAKILVVGLNPAWQNVLQFSDLKWGGVNRASTLQSLASGKGMNVAKVLKRLGHEVWLLQILGGENGKRIQRECRKRGIKTVNIWVKDETRVCSTLVDSRTGSNPNQVTEIIEPFEIEFLNKEKILKPLKKLGMAFDAMAISGSVPKGVENFVYRDFLKLVRAKINVVDAWQGLDLKALSHVTCIKINQFEFLKFQKKVAGSSKKKKSLEKFSIPFAVTNGSRNAEIIQNGKVQKEIKLPRLDRLDRLDRLLGLLGLPSIPKLPRHYKIVNPIGAGDTVTAGLLHFLVNGVGLSESFMAALAMGSASCLTLLPGEYQNKIMQKILKEMKSKNV